MACDHARLGDAHDMRVLAQSDVELKRAYRDVLRQWNPQARIAMTYRVGNHQSGRMSRGCGFWYGMSAESATVCGRGLFKILISRNCMMGLMSSVPERWIGDRVPNTLYLSPSLLQGIQSNMDIPIRGSGRNVTVQTFPGAVVTGVHRISS
jgi:hypothetical protein